MKAVVFTLGCKVNEVESSLIMASLEKMGFEVSDKLGYADAYVLNTCAVTKEAEKKSRQLMARAKKFNPEAKIFVCGCASQKDKESFLKKGVTFVTGARAKQEIITAFAKEYNLTDIGLSLPKQVKTRAFIKIQDGCNNFCSYCVIPYLRGREVSRPLEDILCEISQTESAEIVLNGINVSSYNGGNLIPLIKGLRTFDKRIRFGSLECNVITDEFLSALRELKNFAPQFHLSLQSGSNAVLKAMNRHYTREEYLEKCRKIYEYFPDCAITTDIIAGFPEEGEEDFLQSLSIIGEAGFAKVHAFAFSPREGTAAYKLKDLPDAVKSERLHRLLDEGDKARKKYEQKYFGKVKEIIAEQTYEGYTDGYTDNYIRVYVEGNLCAGKTYKVVLKEFFKDGVKGIIYA